MYSTNNLQSKNYTYKYETIIKGNHAHSKNKLRNNIKTDLKGTCLPPFP
jgi:hypothetical protein